MGAYTGGADFSIQIETDDLDRNWKLLSKIPFEFKEDVAFKAIRETVKASKKIIVKAITDRYYITQKSLLSGAHRAQVVIREELATRLETHIVIESARLPVMRFSVNPRQVPNQKGIPVSARTPILIALTKPARAYKGLFLAKMASGHVGVFREKMPREWSGNTGNTMIEERFMISAVEMVNSRFLRDKIEKRIATKLNRETKKAITEVMRNFGKGMSGKMGETYGGRGKGRIAPGETEVSEAEVTDAE
jgi:hypothetical protein